MQVTVHLFAQARDLAGRREVTVEVTPASGTIATVADLKRALAAACPALAPLVPHLLTAIGGDYAKPSQPLPPLAEIACFPPVSGG